MTEELDRLARASGVLEPLQDTCPSCGERAEIESYEHPQTKEVLYKLIIGGDYAAIRLSCLRHL